MLRPNKLKQALKEQQFVFGLFCSTPAPVIVEMVGCAGFDFIIIDSEHTLVNPETLENMVRAAEVVGLTALVRVPGSSPGPILRALDAGAQGVVVPQIDSQAEAERAVCASYYHPQGERSLNSGRPAGFGKMDLPTYLQRANAEVMVVPMIEDSKGIQALGEILAVPGIDMVLGGAADLSQSLGIPWQTRHPWIREALCQVQSMAQQKGIPFCALPRVREDFTFWKKRGVQTFVLGDERGIAYRALESHLRGVKQALEASKN